MSQFAAKGFLKSLQAFDSTLQQSKNENFLVKIQDSGEIERQIKQDAGVIFNEEITVAHFNKEDAWSDQSKRPKITVAGKSPLTGSNRILKSGRNSFSKAAKSATEQVLKEQDESQNGSEKSRGSDNSQGKKNQGTTKLMARRTSSVQNMTNFASKFIEQLGQQKEKPAKDISTTSAKPMKSALKRKRQEPVKSSSSKLIFNNLFSAIELQKFSKNQNSPDDVAEVDQERQESDEREDQSYAEKLQNLKNKILAKKVVGHEKLKKKPSLIADCQQAQQSVPIRQNQQVKQKLSFQEALELIKPSKYPTQELLNLGGSFKENIDKIREALQKQNTLKEIYAQSLQREEQEFLKSRNYLTMVTLQPKTNLANIRTEIQEHQQKEEDGKSLESSNNSDQEQEQDQKQKEVPGKALRKLKAKMNVDYETQSRRTQFNDKASISMYSAYSGVDRRINDFSSQNPPSDSEYVSDSPNEKSNSDEDEDESENGSSSDYSLASSYDEEVADIFGIESQRHKEKARQRQEAKRKKLEETRKQWTEKMQRIPDKKSTLKVVKRAPTRQGQSSKMLVNDYGPKLRRDSGAFTNVSMKTAKPEKDTTIKNEMANLQLGMQPNNEIAKEPKKQETQIESKHSKNKSSTNMSVEKFDEVKDCLSNENCATSAKEAFISKLFENLNALETQKKHYTQYIEKSDAKQSEQTESRATVQKDLSSNQLKSRITYSDAEEMASLDSNHEPDSPTRLSHNDKKNSLKFSKQLMGSSPAPSAPQVSPKNSDEIQKLNKEQMLKQLNPKSRQEKDEKKEMQERASLLAQKEMKQKEQSPTEMQIGLDIIPEEQKVKRHTKAHDEDEMLVNGSELEDTSSVSGSSSSDFSPTNSVKQKQKKSNPAKKDSTNSKRTYFLGMNAIKIESGEMTNAVQPKDFTPNINSTFGVIEPQSASKKGEKLKVQQNKAKNGQKQKKKQKLQDSSSVSSVNSSIDLQSPLNMVMDDSPPEDKPQNKSVRPKVEVSFNALDKQFFQFNKQSSRIISRDSKIDQKSNENPFNFQMQGNVVIRNSEQMNVLSEEGKWPEMGWRNDGFTNISSSNQQFKFHSQPRIKEREFQAQDDKQDTSQSRKFNDIMSSGQGGYQLFMSSHRLNDDDNCSVKSVHTTKSHVRHRRNRSIISQLDHREVMSQPRLSEDEQNGRRHNQLVQHDDSIQIPDQIDINLDREHRNGGRNHNQMNTNNFMNTNQMQEQQPRARAIDNLRLEINTNLLFSPKSSNLLSPQSSFKKGQAYAELRINAKKQRQGQTGCNTTQHRAGHPQNIFSGSMLSPSNQIGQSRNDGMGSSMFQRSIQRRHFNFDEQEVRSIEQQSMNSRSQQQQLNSPTCDNAQQSILDDTQIVDMSEVQINENQIEKISTKLGQLYKELDSAQNDREKQKKTISYNFRSNKNEQTSTQDGKMMGVFTIQQQVEVDLNRVTPLAFGNSAPTSTKNSRKVQTSAFMLNNRPAQNVQVLSQVVQDEEEVKNMPIQSVNPNAQYTSPEPYIRQKHYSVPINLYQHQAPPEQQVVLNIPSHIQMQSGENTDEEDHKMADKHGKMSNEFVEPRGHRKNKLSRDSKGNTGGSNLMDNYQFRRVGEVQNVESHESTDRESGMLRSAVGEALMANSREFASAKNSIHTLATDKTHQELVLFPNSKQRLKERRLIEYQMVEEQARMNLVRFDSDANQAHSTSTRKQIQRKKRI